MSILLGLIKRLSMAKLLISNKKSSTQIFKDQLKALRVSHDPGVRGRYGMKSLHGVELSLLDAHRTIVGGL